MGEAEKLVYIQEHMSYTARLLQLAEEASELSQACIKLTRAMNLIDSPTPMNEDQALANLIEEISDVYLCTKTAGFTDAGIWNDIQKTAHMKLDRTYDRLIAKEAADNQITMEGF